MKISKVTAIEMIRGSKGRVFGVTFIKRTTGEVRTMQARLGVKKGVTGEGLKFNPKDYALIPVYEMPMQQFRMVNLEGLTNLSIEGEKYEVE